jgi:hypothetical protein
MVSGSYDGTVKIYDINKIWSDYSWGNVKKIVLEKEQNISCISLS